MIGGGGGGGVTTTIGISTYPWYSWPQEQLPYTSTEVSLFLRHSMGEKLEDFSLYDQESSANVMPIADYVDQVQQVIQKTYQKVTANMERAQQQQILPYQSDRKYGFIIQPVLM